MLLAFLLSFVLGPWNIAFNEQTSDLDLTFTEDGAPTVHLDGTLAFQRETDALKFVLPRDNGPRRLMAADSKGEICGYLSFQQDGSRLEFCLHTWNPVLAKLTGEFSWTTTFKAEPRAFACRVQPTPGDRVISMATPGGDSLRNNAVFLPETDTLIEFFGENVRVETQEAGSFQVRVSGQNRGTFGVRVVKNYFKNREMPYYAPLNRARCPRVPTGWMAWNIYFDQATAADNLKEARVGKQFLQPFGLEFWSIESWQGNSDVLPVAHFHSLDLSCNEKQFPQGMKAVADEIRALGFRPGMWVVPFGTGDDEFYAAHKNWFMHEPDGRPVRTWSGKYTLDPTHPEVLAHVRKMLETCSHAWGYEFFKIDGMSASWPYTAQQSSRPEIKKGLFDPNAPDPNWTFVHNFREAIGEDRIFLACGAALTAPGLTDCDATRIGGDIVSPNQPVDWAHVKHQAGATLARYYSHNIVAYNDPDTLMVNEALSLEEARVTTTVVSLPGQVMFSGDKLSELPAERMALIQKTLPVADVHPMDLYVRGELLPIWNLAVCKPFGRWNVTALFNWSDENDEIGFDFSELGLPNDHDFMIYEVWTNSFLGTARGHFAMEVPPHAVRLLAIHPAADHPQFLASDRHVAQGAVELEDLNWDGEKNRLTFRVNLIENHPTTLRFHVPTGWTCTSPNTRQEADGRVLAVTFKSEKTETVERDLEFQKTSRE